MRKIVLLILISINILNAQNNCKKIERRVDEFTGKITINSPLSLGMRLNPLIIYKFIDESNKQGLYALSLRAYGSTLSLGKKEIIVLFEDGTKWQRDAELDAEPSSSGYEYSVFIPLQQEDLTTFSTKKISKYRLYIYDTEIATKNGEKFRVDVECVLNTI